MSSPTSYEAAPAYAPASAVNSFSPSPSSSAGGVPSQWARNPSQWTQPPAWSRKASRSAPPFMPAPATYEAAAAPAYAPMSTPSSAGGVPSQWARNPSQWTQPPAWSSK
eukprot:5496040-Pleurochrysis_carterae.AAC.1